MKTFWSKYGKSLTKVLRLIAFGSIGLGLLLLLMQNPLTAQNRDIDFGTKIGFEVEGRSDLNSLIIPVYYTRECPGVRTGEIEARFTSSTTPPKEGLRVVVTNISQDLLSVPSYPGPVNDDRKSDGIDDYGKNNGNIIDNNRPYPRSERIIYPRNRRRLSSISSNPFPYTDRAYDQGRASEATEVSFGTKHSGRYFMVLEGYNRFKYEIKKGTTVLEEGEFTADVRANMIENERRRGNEGCP